jgi:hypothetical protein
VCVGGFVQVQEHQKLMVDFPEYPNVLIRMLNNCIKEPHRCFAAYIYTHTHTYDATYMYIIYA